MAIQFTDAFTAIVSENFDATIAFSTAVLGREPADAGRPGRILPAGGFLPAIFRPRVGGAADFRNRHKRGGGLGLVLRGTDVERAAVEHMRLSGLEPSQVMESSNVREVYGYDPDGNRIILVEGAA